MKKIIPFLVCTALLTSSLPYISAQAPLDDLTVANASDYTVTDGYIERIGDFPCAGEVASNFRDPRNVTVTAADGTVLAGTDPVGSDATVTYANGNTSVKTYVPGDTNGDAKINAKDATPVLKQLAGYSPCFCEKAADVTHDNTVNAKDVSVLMKYCAGWNIALAVTPDDSPTAEADDPEVEMYFDTILTRRCQADTSTTGEHRRTVCLAKNEIEDAQIFITSTSDKKDMSLDMSTLTGDGGATLPAELLVGYYYDFGVLDTVDESSHNIDPLLKLTGTFDLAANTSKEFAVQIKAPADAQAGLYKSRISLKNADGIEVKALVLTVRVWDFTLDEDTACDTAFGLNQVQGTDDYKLKYDFLLENRICSYALPYDITDPRADEYLSNPRVSFVMVRGAGNGGVYDRTDEYVTEAYRKLRTDPTWLDKGYIYTVDEPCCESDFQLLRDQWKHTSELIPEMDFQIICPLAGNSYGGNMTKDFVEEQIGYITTLCPQTHAFKEYVTKEMREEKPDGYYDIYDDATYGFTGGMVYKKYGQFRERYEKYREDGLKAWWYVCCAPSVPYPNLFQFYQGIHTRVILWQQYMFDVDGLLYWAVNNYDLGRGNFTYVDLKHTNGGDGLLLYEHTMFGQTTPVPSIRMEYVRDGIEDFQYLTQLEEITGSREASMEFVEKVTQDILHYDKNPNTLESVRVALGYTLEAATK